MAQEATSSVALLPIRPLFVKAILEGRKSVEFRRRPFGQEVSNVVVYATSPIQRVVAFFSVTHVTEGHPHEVWKQFGAQGGVSREDYDAYFQGSERAVAIGIGDLRAFTDPLGLDDLSPSLRAPQSYCYLSVRTFQLLCEGRSFTTWVNFSLKGYGKTRGGWARSASSSTGRTGDSQLP